MFEPGGKQIFLVCGATDMRKGIDGLSSVVNVRFVSESEPYDSALFIFCNRSRDKVKILEWDGDGFWLCQKRLEKGTFPWPRDNSGIKRIILSADEFSCLISGTKLRRRLSMDEVFPHTAA